MNRVLELEMLQLLKELGPDLQMPENAMYAQLRLRVRPVPTTMELVEAKNSLEADQRILGIRTRDGVKYSITVRGEKDLYEARNL